MLEPYAGKLARTVLRGPGGQQCLPGYPTLGSNLLRFDGGMSGERFLALPVGERHWVQTACSLKSTACADSNGLRAEAACADGESSDPGAFRWTNAYGPVSARYCSRPAGEVQIEIIY